MTKTNRDCLSCLQWWRSFMCAGQVVSVTCGFLSNTYQLQAICWGPDMVKPLIMWLF